jgi:hypothetical protein
MMETPLEAGRTASPEELDLFLPSAPPTYLEGALTNPGLGPAQVPLLLKNPGLTAHMIQRISRNRSWMKVYETKAAVVLHPRTPRAVAMNFVAFLWWRDLVRVVDRTVLAPPLRRTAERLVGVRLQELALGEKIALARIASRGIINTLRRDGSPMVIKALLQNPRLIEEAALSIANHPSTTPGVLRVLAEDSRWSTRPAVQKAIARNPETPSQVALRIVRRLGANDLKEMARAARVPALVKVAAQRLLESRRRGADRKGRRGGS